MAPVPLVIKLFDEEVDVSEWQHKHPGGSKLLKIFENRDATQQFNAIHKGDRARKTLAALPRVKSEYSSPAMNPVEIEFRELIETMKPAISKVHVWYEILKLTYILSFVSGGYTLCLYDHQYIGLTMLCLAIYQAGWVGHDYSHRSILPNPVHNNMVSDFLGTIQGYSDIWWKLRHNTHHMVTNEIGNDPDIRTEPVFHFFDKTTALLNAKADTSQSKSIDSEKLVAPSKESKPKSYRKAPKSHMPLQHIFFTFLLSLLDIFWRYESFVVLLKSPRRYRKELAMLAVHYSLMGSLLIFSSTTVWNLLAFSLAKGFMTAIVVFANHYPEDRLPPDHKMGFFEQTLRTSRNTTGLIFNHPGAGFVRSLFNEATGYLSMQIEHHLVPTWPSGNLMQLRPHVMALAAKYDIPYCESSILGATVENIAKLSNPSLEDLKKIG